MPASSTAQRVHEMELPRLDALYFAAAKWLLLATVIHEVRTPMNGVFGPIKPVLGTCDWSDDAGESADHAQLPALNLLDLLNGILAFGRNEMAGVTLNPADSELGP